MCLRLRPRSSGGRECWCARGGRSQPRSLYMCVYLLQYRRSQRLSFASCFEYRRRDAFKPLSIYRSTDVADRLRTHRKSPKVGITSGSMYCRLSEPSIRKFRLREPAGHLSAWIRSCDSRSWPARSISHVQPEIQDGLHRPIVPNLGGGPDSLCRI